ncbi:MAG: acetyltransferase-like isoleucine patch superfamily enzyme [Desulforhopalus sp.]|jgi:acetyltransferase-like isoleucine patch superfamily enzyme
MFVKKLIHYIGGGGRTFYYIFLRSAGVTIGKGTMISLRAKIDTRRGKIIIGKNSHITYGCILLSHDGSAKQRIPGADGLGQVVIGDNVFVGVGSIILPNVTIGDNSVIGAGSVVSKDIPANVVAVGNPAKVIKHLKERCDFP